MIIKEVHAGIVKDSRGKATIEVSVNKSTAASSPSGKSTGTHESKPYYKDLGACVRFLNDWDELTIINEFADLKRVENHIMQRLKLKNAKEFGGNALYAFESAVLKALAREKKKELWEIVNSKTKPVFPRPIGNAVGGGVHSEQFEKHPVFQEFLIIPRENRFEDNVSVMKKIYQELGLSLGVKQVNDEGAWAAGLNDEEVLHALSKYSDSVDLGVDVAASTFYQKEYYSYGALKRTPPAHIEHVAFLMKAYGIFYVEDPCEQEDFAGFASLRKALGESIAVSDDLTATHENRFDMALHERAIGGMIIKPNQNGSLIEVKALFELCKKHGIKTVMSHRSGETMDDALADYAFAFGADFIKCGIATPWRECKLQRLIAIERGLK